jgi:hypothetical protein
MRRAWRGRDKSGGTLKNPGPSLWIVRCTALLLTIAGITVCSYSVARRTREMGVRIAWERASAMFCLWL